MIDAFQDYTPKPERAVAFTPSDASGRAALLKAAQARAVSSGRAVYYLKRDGRAVTGKARPRVYGSKRHKTQVKIPVEREATHVCVEGDDKWTPLPCVTTAHEDYLMTPKVKKRKRRGE